MFENLLKPLQVGNIQLKRRIIMPPMATNFATEEGFVTDTLKAHLAARAKGGSAMVIPGMTCVDAPVGKGVKRQLCCSDDKHIPGLTEFGRGGSQVGHSHSHAAGARRLPRGLALHGP